MIKKIKSYINKSEFVKNTVTLLTGTTIAQIIPVLISPLLSRLFDPEDFGFLALYMSIVSILAVFSTARYEMAIVLPKKKSDSFSLLSLSAGISFVYAGLLLAVLLIFFDYFKSFAGFSGNSFLLYFVPLSVLSLGLYKSLTYWFNRENKFNKIANSKVVNTSLNGSSSLFLGFLKNSNGLVFGWIIGQITSMLYLVFLFFQKEYNNFRKVRIKNLYQLIKRYKKFPLFDSWSELLRVLSNQLPVFIIIYFFSEEIAGHYSFTYRILLIPFSLLSFSMSQAYFRQANVLKNEDKSLGNFTYGIFKKLILISFIPLSVASILGDVLFPLVFGGEWIIAGNYSRLISLWVFSIFLTAPFTTIFAVLEKQQVNLVFNLISFVVRLGALVVLAVFYNDHYIAINFYVVSGFIVRILYAVYIYKLTKIDFKRLIYFICKLLIPTIFVLFLLRYIIIGNLV